MKAELHQTPRPRLRFEEKGAEQEARNLALMKYCAQRWPALLRETNGHEGRIYLPVTGPSGLHPPTRRLTGTGSVVPATAHRRLPRCRNVALIRRHRPTEYTHRRVYAHHAAVNWVRERERAWADGTHVDQVNQSGRPMTSGGRVQRDPHPCPVLRAESLAWGTGPVQPPGQELWEDPGQQGDMLC
ncbi:hypothetical protein SKAU_G00141010 [Synaphobranchus kaupii]|uniref:Uncharacterized protein n=1 Tax=Synaphobranchus kaupii TaxID=118154 RepID=A0A9Q1J4E8_SYNKA|nr:hypothetical protein SKAU_G00141010 [Synaphobranchus kaupii]